MNKPEDIKYDIEEEIKILKKKQKDMKNQLKKTNDLLEKNNETLDKIFNYISSQEYRNAMGTTLGDKGAEKKLDETLGKK